MAKVTLAAKTREGSGTIASKKVRAQGNIPGIVYGHGMKPVSLQVNEKELLTTLHTKAGENVVIDLKLEGAKLKESTCLVKEIQHHPVTDRINHVDFAIVSLTETIHVKVPIVVENQDESAGLKEGGVLDVIHHEIEVECRATEIPEKFTVDVKEMNINDVVHIKELSFPSGVKSLLEADEAIVAIHPPTVEEEAAPVEEDATAEPEVIEKGKKPEEGAEGGDKAAAPKEEKAKKE